jgi:steroid delta-isomerase-like uncharacterized protein
MSAETSDRKAANRALVHRFVDEVWAKGDLDAIPELFTADSVLHDPDGDLVGHEAFEDYNRTYLEAFPDLEYGIEDMVAEGDRVAFRARMRATHRGEFRGSAPTGRSFDAEGIVIAHIENGKIAERWASFDALGIMRQLGLSPESES